MTRQEQKRQLIERVQKLFAEIEDIDEQIMHMTEDDYDDTIMFAKHLDSISNERLDFITTTNF